MAKLLQWLLAITLLSNGALLIYYFIGVSLVMWNADHIDKKEMEGTQTLKYEIKTIVKEYALGRSYSKDSLHPEGMIQTYLHLQSAKTAFTENGKPFIYQGKTKYFLDNSSPSSGMLLPISEKQYFVFKLGNLLVCLIAIIGLFLFILLLYKFSRSAVLGEFFSLSNINRLKWLGSMIIAGFSAVHLLDWVIGNYLANYMEYSGIIYHRSYSMVPFELIMGLMLWVIAGAFQKGLELQKDQQLTI
jgi:hypothetical protein